MGYYVNPSAESFAAIARNKTYVDKTGLIEYMNTVVQTDRMLVCSSRPRRFGKSFAAKMLAAYYSRGADSKDIFQNLKIGKETECEHQNQYDVIFLDITLFLSIADTPDLVVKEIQKDVIQELKSEFPESIHDETESLLKALMQIHSATKRKFFIIIDEWDALFREAKQDTTIQREYIQLLRSLFKNNVTPQIIAGAYMTGILPIKKYGTQSALTDFRESTMLEPGPLAPFVGFTQVEVKRLCEEYPLDFDQAQKWYDGYFLDDCHVYNPKAVVSAMTRKKVQNYWSQTASYKSVLPFISMNFDGLKTAIMEMYSGSEVEVNVGSFQNNISSFSGKDDVLTYLIHLGYLGYDQYHRTAFIPNEEIRQEFQTVLKEEKWDELHQMELASYELLDATLDMDAETVSHEIDLIHRKYASSIQYNNENSLSCVITIAYLSSMRYYFKPVRELQSGYGFADLVYIPKPKYQNSHPALLIELKWNKNTETAITQIKEKKYPESIEEYTGDILLVGISYDKKTKVHECVIEKYRKG